MRVALTYAVIFLGLATAIAATAEQHGGGWRALWWPAIAVGYVGVAYLLVAPHWLGKRSDGSMHPAAGMLLLPYLGFNWLVWYVYRAARREECWNEVAPGLYLGRRAYAHELPPKVALIIDLTAEFSEPQQPAHAGYAVLPTLDATCPSEQPLRALAERAAAETGGVYVHCAFGHGRSALVVATVLLARGVAADADEALEIVREARPTSRLNVDQRQLLARWAR